MILRSVALELYLIPKKKGPAETQNSLWWLIYRSIVGYVSVKCRSSISQLSVLSIGQWSVIKRSSFSDLSVKFRYRYRYRSCVTNLSDECQLSNGRLSFGQVSATYRWSVDRLGFTEVSVD